ncbi:MAG: hypothetical protein SOZ23_04915 [Methanosphaera sp.]|uniref:hypothetical protein n=1 Tax=Methanosphaera sp. TaxID=2666342 RepID=UPI00260113A7|nr:hypothetical protein [Methanosphaera sp.]MCI5867605.1 hypothetical protein [Methanosphaera sp.]MDD6534072.1 hypothetical protein [Methanosphaera sp.]MDY3956118.1 hypothetical protein [Methanosphaera sp.]
MPIHEIKCRIIDNTYEDDDFDILTKIVLDHRKKEIYAWDGIEWNKDGFKRIYSSKKQIEYNEFYNRIAKLVNSGLLFEIANDLNEDESYLFENERIYIYIEERKDL